MAAQGGLGFNSRAARVVDGGAPRPNAAAHVGPGAYEVPGAIGAEKPAYTGFSSTADRNLFDAETDTPGPGVYELPQSITVDQRPSGFVRSKTQRFAQPTKSASPGPGSYEVELMTAMSNRVQHRNRQSRHGHARMRKRASGTGDLMLQSASPGPSRGGFGRGSATSRGQKTSDDFFQLEWVRLPSAPSIPTRAQSYGYEEAPTGELVMQTPANFGFSGRGADTVGPADYDPDPGSTRPVHAAPDFSKSSARILHAKNLTPGPGHYNTVQSMAEEGGGRESTDIAQSLGDRSPARQRAKQTAVFRSEALRESLEMKYKATVPGPGHYNLGTGISPEQKAERFQNFGCSVSRLNQPTRSLRVGPGPGSYDQSLSDFDHVAARAESKHRQTQARAKSGTVPAVFDSTTARFLPEKQRQPPTVGPGSYNPRTTLADAIKQPKGRHAAFSTTEKRFYRPLEGNNEPASAQQEQQPLAGGGPSADGGPTPVVAGTRTQGPGAGAGTTGGTGGTGVGGAGGTRQGTLRSGSTMKRIRSAPHIPEHELEQMSAAFKSRSGRYNPVKHIMDVPPPGYYNPQPKWSGAKGVIAMGKNQGERFQREQRTSDNVGPGAYRVESSLLDKRSRRNRKNVFGSNEARFHAPQSREVRPGPGAYIRGDRTTLYKPTHNIALAEQVMARQF